MGIKIFVVACVVLLCDNELEVHHLAWLQAYLHHLGEDYNSCSTPTDRQRMCLQEELVLQWRYWGLIVTA